MYLPRSRRCTAQTSVWPAICSHSCTADRVCYAAKYLAFPPAELLLRPVAEHSTPAQPLSADAATAQPKAPQHNWLQC